MDTPDQLREKLEVYEAITAFLNDQSCICRESKKDSLVIARDCLRNVHLIFSERQHSSALAARTASSIFAQIMTHARHETDEKQQDSPRSPPLSASSHQLEPVKLAADESSETEKSPQWNLAHRFATAREELNIPDDARSYKKTGTTPKVKLPPTSFKPAPKAEDFRITKRTKLLSTRVTEKPKVALVTEDDKDEAENRKAKGNNLMISGEYELALEEYSKAIELNRSGALYFYKRGVAHSHLSHHDSCVQDLERAVELDSTFGRVYGLLADEYKLMGMLPKAKAAYLKALSFEPKNEIFKTSLDAVEDQLKVEQIQAEKPVPLADYSASDFESDESRYDPRLVKVTKQIFQDPGARNIVAGMFETNAAEQNTVVDLFIDVRDNDPDSFKKMYKYPVEHTLEEYDTEAKMQKKEDEEDNKEK